MDKHGNIAVCANIYSYDVSHYKRLESFEMWRWRRMEKISWTDHVRNGEV